MYSTIAIGCTGGIARWNVAERLAAQLKAFRLWAGLRPRNLVVSVPPAFVAPGGSTVAP
jgi:hypothetical protein